MKAQSVCPVSGKKHRFVFVKNTVSTKSSSTPYGTMHSQKVVGLWQCLCGERKHRAPNPNHECDLRKLAPHPRDAIV